MKWEDLVLVFVNDLPEPNRWCGHGLLFSRLERRDAFISISSRREKHKCVGFVHFKDKRLAIKVRRVDE